MISKKVGKGFNLGKIIGFCFSYAIFTVIFYFVGVRIFTSLEDASLFVFPAFTFTILSLEYAMRKVMI